MQCKDIEVVLEQEGLEPLSNEARAHLAECRDCRSYVADLTSLVDAAKKLPRKSLLPSACGIPSARNSKKKASYGLRLTSSPWSALPSGNR